MKFRSNSLIQSFSAPPDVLKLKNEIRVASRSENEFFKPLFDFVYQGRDRSANFEIPVLFEGNDATDVYDYIRERQEGQHVFSFY